MTPTKTQEVRIMLKFATIMHSINFSTEEPYQEPIRNNDMNQHMNGEKIT